MRVIHLIRRLRNEFTEMPGLRLRAAQVARLCGVDGSTSAAALNALVSTGFLSPTADGHYGRTDVVTRVPGTRLVGGRSGVPPTPWRRILCLVSLDDQGNRSLSPTSRSALRYATTLAVTHRARITALQVVPQPSAETAASLRDELRTIVSGQAFDAPIDVRVAAGPANQDLTRVAKTVDADLIVIGRSETEPLSWLSDTVRHAPCPVLIVHPSGRAAVA